MVLFLFLYYLRIENAEGNVLIAVYLFMCMRVTRITQSIKPNLMKFGGMIGFFTIARSISIQLACN